LVPRTERNAPGYLVRDLSTLCPRKLSKKARLRVMVFQPEISALPKPVAAAWAAALSRGGWPARPA